MYITKIQLINATHKRDIHHLLARLNRQPGYQFKLDPHVLEIGGTKHATHFLSYENQQLTSYMLTHFYTADVLEVTMVGVTQTHFNIFLDLAMELACTDSFKTIELIIDQQDKESNALALQTGLVYDHSEYRLVLNPDYKPQTKHAELTIRWATMADIITLDRLDRQGFGDFPAELNPNITQIHVAEIDNTIIGKIKQETTSESFGIFAFVVDRKYQGKGYGQEMLNRIVAFAQANAYPYIFLEVDVANPRALKLYQRTGFELLAEFSYYTLDLNTLKTKV